MKSEAAQQLPEPVLDVGVLKAAIRAGVEQRRMRRAHPAREGSPPPSLTLAEMQAIDHLGEEPSLGWRLLQVRSFLQLSEAHLGHADRLVRTVLTPLVPPPNPSRWQRIKLWIRERLGRMVGMHFQIHVDHLQDRVNHALLDCLYDLHRAMQRVRHPGERAGRSQAWASPAPQEEPTPERLHLYCVRLERAGLGSPAKPVLDLGWGAGAWTTFLSQRGLSVQTVDAGAAPAVEVWLPYLETRPAEEVGAVSLLQTIQHLPPDLQVRLLAESARVLVPGGLVVMESVEPGGDRTGPGNELAEPIARRLLESFGLRVETLHAAEPDPSRVYALLGWKNA
jgi:hypothetical protein